MTLWIIFSAIVLFMLAIDLGIFRRKVHDIKLREATVWSIVWILVSAIFGISLFFFWPENHPVYTQSSAVATYFTCYLIEKSLSVDNIFVFIIIFHYFQVQEKHHHKILFWGIVGAVLMRAIFISLGITILNNLTFMIYVFGLFLIYTGVKLIKSKDVTINPENNPALKLLRKFFPITQSYSGDKFFIKENNKWFASPLLVVLIVIETTDLTFAVDSIPAALAITQDPFLIYSSNIFAILGLRALYFVLREVLNLFCYLQYGLSIILVFIGTKMILTSIDIHFPTNLSLIIVLGILGLAIGLSLLFPPKNDPKKKGETYE